MRPLSLASLAAALVAVLAVTPAPAQHLSADGAPQTFHFLSEQYFRDIYFHYSPTAGTSAGFHDYDTQLEDYSSSAVKSQAAALHAIEKKLAEIDPSALDADPAADYAILLNNVRLQLLHLEVIRDWEKNADSYSSGVTNSIFVLMERPYAPANVRLRAAVARERLIPEAFTEARRNLKNPPKIYTEVALDQIDGDVSFFEHDVPEAFKDADDAAAKAEFATTNAAVIAALKSYGVWLRSDLLPRSNGDFRYGADTYRKALAYQEMVDTPLDKLLQIGLDDLHRNQAEFARVAKAIDPTKTPQQELAELTSIHPAPSGLLGAFQAEFNAEIAFIAQHHLITIPTDVQPTLEETPPFMRATTQASMDPPGPFERNSTKAYFNVTLPDPRWDAKKTEEYMGEFNIGTLISVSVHEAYPGHYVQFAWTHDVTDQSKVALLLGASTNVEGWAHYCEQMMLDEGLAQAVAKNEREANLMRLGQIQDALLRDARFVVAIRMHTGIGGPMSTDEATAFFVTEGYQPKPIAEVETRRGTSDALYLYYTLGKLEIMKLREDLKKKQGAAFSLEEFHDAFMRQGTVPISIIRKSMLHDSSPVL